MKTIFTTQPDQTRCLSPHHIVSPLVHGVKIEKKNQSFVWLQEVGGVCVTNNPTTEKQHMFLESKKKREFDVVNNHV